ncbi:MAG: glycosyltransferase family 2 protein [Candidatus Hodarchaeales archaeon]
MNIDELLVVIPVYNEEKQLKLLMNKIIRIFAKKNLIIADDGSKDATTKISRSMGILTVRHKNNEGKGSILKKTFQFILDTFPDKKWIITLDGDNQHNPQDILKFIDAISKNPNIDIWVGSRDYKKMPLFNRVSNQVTSGWCRYWLKWEVSDIQCGFRAYSIKALKKLPLRELKRKKFDFETEILLKAWLKQLKIKEVPISTIYLRNHRKSKILPSVDTLRWIILMTQFGFSPSFLPRIFMNRKKQTI